MQHIPLGFSTNRDDCLRVSMHPLRLKERSQVPVHLLIKKKKKAFKSLEKFLLCDLRWSSRHCRTFQKGSGQCCGKSVFQHLQSKLKKGLGSNTLQQATLISPSTHLLPSGPRGREITVCLTERDTHLALWMFDSRKDVTA